MRYKFTSPGKPDVIKDEMTTDTYLRIALGDNANTTARLMTIAAGHPHTFTYRGVRLTVARVETVAAGPRKGLAGQMMD